MKKKILVDQSIINNINLSSEAICVYIAIMAFSIPKDDEIFINNTKLEYYLFGNKMSRNEHLAMTKGLKDLSNNGYISIIQKMNSTDYIYNYENINQREIKQYFYVDRDDIRSIMNLDTNLNKYKILKYYACLLGTFYKNKNEKDLSRAKIGFQPQTNISLISGISISTINEYNKLLEKEKIIYILKTVSNANNTIKRRIIYSRYEDKDFCINYCKERGINTGMNAKLDQSDSRRKDIEIYKHMVKGKIYDNEVVKRVFKTIDDINSSIIIGCESDEYNEPFDMSVFKKYGLI